MAWLTVLSSGALGVVIGWIVKEMIDFWKRKEAHRAELQKRFFDAQLETTLKALQRLKTLSASIRTTTELVAADVAAGGTTNSEIMAGTFRNADEEIKRVNENALGAIALLGFFYGEAVAGQADEAGRSAMTPIVQNMSIVFENMPNHWSSVSEMPEDQRSAALVTRVKADTVTQAAAAEAVRYAVALDRRVDEITSNLRKKYRSTFTYGFEG